jgi:hypothetical protein
LPAQHTPPATPQVLHTPLLVLDVQVRSAVAQAVPVGEAAAGQQGSPFLPHPQRPPAHWP